MSIRATLDYANGQGLLAVYDTMVSEGEMRRFRPAKPYYWFRCDLVVRPEIPFGSALARYVRGQYVLANLTDWLAPEYATRINRATAW